MKLDVGRFAVAVATIWTLAGLVCAFIFKAAPDAYARGANFLLHTDMYRVGRVVGWGELLLALVAWWMLVAAISGAAAGLYNRLAPSERSESQSRARAVAHV